MKLRPILIISLCLVLMGSGILSAGETSRDIIRVTIPATIVQDGLPRWMSRHIPDILNGYFNSKAGYLSVEPPDMDFAGLLEGKADEEFNSAMSRLGIRYLVASRMSSGEIDLAVHDTATGETALHSISTGDHLSYGHILNILENLPRLGIPVHLQKYELHSMSYKGADSREAYLKALEIFHGQEDPISATGEIEKALTMDPANISAQLLQARVFTIAGRFEDASAIYDEILKKDTGNLGSLLGKGLVLAASSEFDAGAGWFAEALNRRPGNILLMYNRAYCLERANDPGGAEGVYLEILKADPHNQVARYNLGVLYQSLGIYSRSLVIFNQLKNDNPRQPLYAYLTASALLGEGRVEEARNELAELSRRGEFKEVYNDLGLIERARGNNPGAMEYFRKALSADSSYLPALNNLGIVHLAAGDYAPAREAFEKALQMNPVYSEALYNLGILEMNRENFDRAWVYFARVYQQNPRIYQAGINRGICELKMGKLDEALKTLQGLEEEHPGSSLLLYNLGVINRMMGEPARALDYFYRVLALSPDHVDAMVNASSILIVSGEYHKARSLLDRAKILAPKNSLVWFNRGLLEYFSGNHKVAVGDLSRTLEIEPSLSRARRFLARAMLMEGMYLPAREQIEILVNQDPGDYQSRYLMAVYYQRTGQPGKAVHVLESMTDDSRYYLQGYYYLARLYYDMGEYIKAGDNYRELIHLEPDKIEHRLGLARTAYMAGQLDMAGEISRKIIQMEPRNVLGYHFLGVVLIEEKKFQEAAEIYKKALRLDPDNLNYRVNYSLCLAHSGQGHEARTTAKELAREYHDSPDINYVVAAVHALTGDAQGMLFFLRRAFELNPQLRDRALKDQDFAKYHQDPRFRKAVEAQ